MTDPKAPELTLVVLPAAEAGKAPGGKAEDFGYPDPTEADLADPSFEAVWQAIKGWDVSREPGTHRMYAGTTGNDVMHILAALRAEAGKAQAEWEDLLNAARMVITAHTCKHPDLSREEAESRAMRALIVAVDAFPHPCAAAAIPPPPSAPEGT